MLTGDDVVSDPPLVDEEIGLDVGEEPPTLDEIEDCASLEVEDLYPPTNEDDASTPPDVDEETGLEVWEPLLMDEPENTGDELLKDPDVLFPIVMVVTGEELKVGVVARPVTRQEQAEEIEEGELWH
jgi:hypothetical protein